MSLAPGIELVWLASIASFPVGLEQSKVTLRKFSKKRQYSAVFHILSMAQTLRLVQIMAAWELGLSQLFYFSAYYSIQNFPKHSPIIPRDWLIILGYSHKNSGKLNNYIAT